MRLCADGCQRRERGPHLHTAAPLVVGRGAPTGIADHGGAAGRTFGGLSRLPQVRPFDRRDGAYRSSRPRRPSGTSLLHHWQRDSGFHRALAWPPQTGTLPRTPLLCRKGGGPRQPRHLCQLSVHRISAASLPRLCLFQRLSRIPEMSRCLSGPPAQHCRRPAIGYGGDGPGRPSAW